MVMRRLKSLASNEAGRDAVSFREKFSQPSAKCRFCHVAMVYFDGELELVLFPAPILVQTLALPDQESLTYGLTALSDLSAVDVRFLVFDVWGNRLETLS